MTLVNSVPKSRDNIVMQGLDTLKSKRTIFVHVCIQCIQISTHFGGEADSKARNTDVKEKLAEDQWRRRLQPELSKHNGGKCLGNERARFANSSRCSECSDNVVSSAERRLHLTAMFTSC